MMRRTLHQARLPPKPFRVSFRRALCILSILLVLATCLFFAFAFSILHTEENKHDNFISSSLKRQRNVARRNAPQIHGPLRRDGQTAPAEESNRDEWLVQQYLLRTMNRSSLPLTAYVEAPLRKGTPLPLRTANQQLQEYAYDESVQSCQDFQNSFPVGHSVALDTRFGPNVGELLSLYPLREQYAPICPVDADPFLPWIHDVFPTADGQFVEFVAHNKRRCRTGPSFLDDLKNLEPQVAIMQSVPVKRLTAMELDQMPSVPNHWKISRHDSHLNNNSTHTHRYRLASLEDADEDGRETRFICYFHTLRPTENGENVEKIVLGETLSVFPYNYEHANFRKGQKPHPMLTRPKDAKDIHGAHNEQVWNSVLHFRCPIPSELKGTIEQSQSIVQNVPSLYVDLVPIRTPPREIREGYCPQVPGSSFDPKKEWGDEHVLPPVEESGRWANIPICRPPASNGHRNRVARKRAAKPLHHNPQTSNKDPNARDKTVIDKDYLIGCLWASAAFSTRGVGSAIDASTPLRLLEWLVYHLYIAKLDHVYVYDNTEAFTNQTSLQPVLDLFPSDRVTRIPWKFRVCNNNRPAHENAGERSSQYTAETSCRLRYGPTTEWMISFDTDEYLIPQDKWSNLKQWLKDSVESGTIGKNTHILSFFQTRALPNVNFMEAYHENGGTKLKNQCGGSTTDEASQCLAKRSNATYLEAYDCETTKLPKPDFGWRAKKQIYRPAFVLNHFVHYTTVTRRIHDAPEEASPLFIQPRPYERRVDELTEAFMLHTKMTPPPATYKWKNICRENNKNKKCPVGIPWPLEAETSPVSQGQQQSMARNKDGLLCNCYQHERIQKDLAIQLRTRLKPLLEKYVQLNPSCIEL